jgi:predicted NAD/FAD-binding protein
MKRIAVIGSGIAGMSAAYFLSRKYEVALFEKEDRIGGHTHTHRVSTSRGVLPIDSGFIVHNERTYPNLVKLFRELRVVTESTDMSFGVWDTRTGLQYSSRGLTGFFASRGSVSRDHLDLFFQIMRFNRDGRRFIRHIAEKSATADVRMTLAAFVKAGRYSRSLLERYLYPMTSAVWSMPVEDVERFPAITLLRFFNNHGMLSLNSHPQWKVLRGGSSTYIAPLTAPYRERIRTGLRHLIVTRESAGVAIYSEGRKRECFDEVVFACPAGETLICLAEPTVAEREVLGALRTSRTEAVLHSDASLLPSIPSARASWNYRVSGESQRRPTLTYHMNRLQNLGVAEDYCVSLNETAHIDESKVLQKMVYHHPLYDGGALRAQEQWDRISGVHRTHYCGAYWFYGFHEDGLNSALRVARRLEVAC